MKSLSGSSEIWIKSSMASGVSMRIPSMYGRKLTRALLEETKLHMMVMRMSIKIRWLPEDMSFRCLSRLLLRNSSKVFLVRFWVMG